MNTQMLKHETGNKTGRKEQEGKQMGNREEKS